MAKQWFVILWQQELEMKATLAEKLVYAAIKSFTANSKQPCIESYLSISKRAGVSDVWTKVAVQNLIAEGWLTQEGEVTKRGGSCPVLKVQTNLELDNSKRSKLLRTSSGLSSNSVSLSSKSSGTKYIQSNKVNNKSNTNNLFDNKTGKENSEVGLTPEKRKEIWGVVNNWSTEKLTQQKGAK